jgi:uncharacterized protein (UPF0333 family)
MTNYTLPSIDTSGDNPQSSGLEWWIWLIIVILIISVTAVIYYISDNMQHNRRISPQASPQASPRRIVAAYDNAAYEETTIVTLHDNPMYVSADSVMTVGNPFYSPDVSSPHYINTSDVE